MKVSQLLFRAILLCLVTASLVASLKAAEKGKSKKADLSDDFFKSDEIPRIQIEISPEGIETLGKYQWRFGTQGERENVSATVREGKNVYTNVALHLKGAAGSFRPVSENPAMTLNFDKNVKKQEFHGVQKLSLNNSVQDQTLVSEQLCRELFAKAGVPVARASHAVVELNGRPLGVYVLVEGFNKQFLKRHFKNANGHLYDGGFLKDINVELDLNSGDDPKDQSDRVRLLEAVKEPDLAKRSGRLMEVLDLDQFLTYMALDIMLWDWDGYPQNRNNWRLYHDPSTGKMTFIPHGLDQMFWKADGSILPPLQGMAAKAVLQVPELRARYFEKLKELRAKVFLPEEMTNRARAIAAKIRPALEDDKEKLEEQQRALDKFCDAIVRRARSLDEQLAHPIKPIEFAPSGEAVLTNWESKSDFGRPSATREADELKLGAADGSSIGTWRSEVWLESGRYRIEGRLKTTDIIPDIGDTRGGAGLRFGKARPEGYTTGSSDWKTVRQDFTVSDPLTQVQIVCEFRGASGEAKFDSIRLRRLP